MQFSSRTAHLFSEGSFGFYRKKKISGNFMFNLKQLIFFSFLLRSDFCLVWFLPNLFADSNVELSNRKWSENNNMQNVNSF